MIGENSHLLGKPKKTISTVHDEEQPSFLASKTGQVLSLLVGLSVCVLGVSTWWNSESSYSLFSSLDSTHTTTDYSYTLTRNGYKTLDYFSSSPSDLYAYKILEDYDALIEPSAEMKLDITSGVSQYSLYKYKVCKQSTNQDTTTCYEGQVSGDPDSEDDNVNVTIDCSPYDEYVITVQEYSVRTEDTISDEKSGKALCMYVRREIRTLTSKDLSDAMDAMYTLWSTPEDVGQSKYGSDFHSAEYLTLIHNFNAAWQDADHIHEGLGFFPQHIKITSIFERAVQAVDPSFALPYWDFTIESSEDKSPFDSVIFTEEAFGSLVHPSNDGLGWTYANDSIELGAIPDGRWAGIKSSLGDRVNLINTFGYLRGPWSLNPSPYVTRYSREGSTLPGCGTHYDLLRYTDLMDFLENAPYESHASTHGSIGGVFGCDLFSQLLEQGYLRDSESQIDLCANWGIYLKELYRSNFITAGDNCSYTGANSLSCSITCNEDEDQIFASKLQALISPDYIPDNMPQSGWAAWKSFLCDGDGYKVFVGDHLESASPSDPSFWVIHPTQERLLHAKMMSGGFENSTWPSSQMEDFVCSKAICYEDSYGYRGNFSECCSGHYQYDQLLDFVHLDKNAGYGPTNDYIMKSTDASSSDYAMNYVYDGFTWPHCASLGVDFDTLMLAFKRKYSANNGR